MSPRVSRCSTLKSFNLDERLLTHESVFFDSDDDDIRDVDAGTTFLTQHVDEQHVGQDDERNELPCDQSDSVSRTTSEDGRVETFQSKIGIVTKVSSSSSSSSPNYTSESFDTASDTATENVTATATTSSEVAAATVHADIIAVTTPDPEENVQADVSSGSAADGAAETEQIATTVGLDTIENVQTPDVSTEDITTKITNTEHKIVPSTHAHRPTDILFSLLTVTCCQHISDFVKLIIFNRLK